MLHALLHGKLDPTIAEPERREDALTSTVFGTLIFLEAWELVGRWLKVPGWRPAAHEELECWFWPRLAGGVEPDVVLRLGPFVVIVEAKYRSGRHDLSPDQVDNERPVDQIVRQHRAVSPPHDGRSPYPELLERAVRECRLLQVFLVDARKIRSARKEYAESMSRLPEGAHVGLVTWQELYGFLLEPAQSGSRWATDLTAYLRACGLASFRGIRRDLAEAPCLGAIVNWRTVANRPADPALRAAAALLASEPAIRDLLHWRPSPASERRQTRR